MYGSRTLRIQLDCNASRAAQLCKHWSSDVEFDEDELAPGEPPVVCGESPGLCCCCCTGGQTKLATRWQTVAQAPCLTNGPDAPWLSNGPPFPYLPTTSLRVPRFAAKGPGDPGPSKGPPVAPGVSTVPVEP